MGRSGTKDWPGRPSRLPRANGRRLAGSVGRVPRISRGLLTSWPILQHVPHTRSVGRSKTIEAGSRRSRESAGHTEDLMDRGPGPGAGLVTAGYTRTDLVNSSQRGRHAVGPRGTVWWERCMANGTVAISPQPVCPVCLAGEEFTRLSLLHGTTPYGGGLRRIPEPPGGTRFPGGCPMQ